jgi:hypothetical protein
VEEWEVAAEWILKTCSPNCLVVAVDSLAVVVVEVSYHGLSE